MERLKKFTFDSEVRLWLSENQNKIKVIDIKYVYNKGGLPSIFVTYKKIGE